MVYNAQVSSRNQVKIKLLWFSYAPVIAKYDKKTIRYENKTKPNKIKPKHLPKS